MIADIEPTSGVLRCWDGTVVKYGEPYQWAATVRWLSRESIEILGDVKPVTREVFRAIIKRCAESGIKRILAVRYRAGQRREKWINVERWNRT